MASNQPFGWKGEPGTCLWCGRKLRHENIAADPSRKGQPGVTWNELSQSASVKAEKAGPYQDNTFDTLNCGYQFGLQMAILGERLELTSS